VLRLYGFKLYLSNIVNAFIVSVVKEEIIGVRVTQELRGALEQERKRMSHKAGAEVKMSAVVRSILERALLPASKATR